MNLGENIYRLRSEHNMSQGDLADALEVSRQSVSKWENNSAVPELDKLVKMAHIFGITLDEMVTGAEAPPAPKAEIPEPAPARSSRLTSAQILGIVLLVFSGLCFLVFTVVGIFVANLLLGLLIGLPFLLCGLVCLLCKKNIGLKCAWAVYLPLWLILTVFIVGGL
jgi:transcriptional regulator with XRE-family HTH domain